MGSDEDIKSLLAQVLVEVGELREENRQLRERVSELEDEVLEARRAAKRQAAPFRRKEKIPQEKQKKSGRKVGHEPAFREPPQQVDRTIEVSLDRHCPDCGSTLEDERSHEHYVVDIPPILPRDVPSRPMILAIRRPSHSSSQKPEQERQICNRLPVVVPIFCDKHNWQGAVPGFLPQSSPRTPGDLDDRRIQ